MSRPRILVLALSCASLIGGSAPGPEAASNHIPLGPPATSAAVPASLDPVIFGTHATDAIRSTPGICPPDDLWNGALEGRPAQQAEKQKVSVWMKAKTEYSRNILAGLTEGDFAKISKNAKSLNFASYLEVLYKADVPGYKQQISLFVDANENLIRLAEDKNLLGATLAFNQLTVSCVQCHQIVRDGKKR